MLPYGKQTIDADDIRAVVECLESPWLTTGPGIDRFESDFAVATGARNAVAVSSGTAALHCAMMAAGIQAGDEVIVPAITFVATANAAVYCGADPVFADVNEDTLLIDPADVRSKITSRTRAVVAMDYGGQPCNYSELRAIADEFDLVLIADACHSLGGEYEGRPVGSLGDLNCFSLHPVKQITSGEGGMITTADDRMAEFMRRFRNHGIGTDHHARARQQTHRYEMRSLGFNYRLTDFQCALGASQLKKLRRFTRLRQQVAGLYDSLLSGLASARPLVTVSGCGHARHLYVIRWERELSGVSRDDVFSQLRTWGIGVNVHYQPVYQHPFYEQRFAGVDHGCPVADAACKTILSLPVFPAISERDVRWVVEELEQLAENGQARNIRAA